MKTIDEFIDEQLAIVRGLDAGNVGYCMRMGDGWKTANDDERAEQVVLSHEPLLLALREALDIIGDYSRGCVRHEQHLEKIRALLLGEEK